MQYGICPLSQVPVRKQASDSSEMISQILFGETFEVIEEKRSWLKVRCFWDKYVGWIDRKQAVEVSEEDYSNPKCAYSLELVQGVMAEKHYIPIVMGSNLPKYDGLKLKLNGKSMTFSGQVINPSETEVDRELIVRIARKYLYTPYQWGGRSPFGIDCSGLTQVVYKMVGIHLPRDAYQQVEIGEPLDFVNEAKPGDLAFFKKPNGRICHVGIVFPEQKILHASGQVRIDNLDHYGIFNQDTKKYSHKLAVVNRIKSD